MKPRIVITGTGVASSIGMGREAFEASLRSGACGMVTSRLVQELGGDDLPAFEILDLDPRPWLGSRGIRVLDRSSRLLAVAAQMALDEAGLLQPEDSEGDPGLGLVCGTLFGSVHSITAFDWSSLQDGPKFVNPMAFPNTVINSPAGQAAIKHRLRGVNSTISAGLASSLYAIHYAAEFLRLGRATALLAGGLEEVCQESYLGFLKNGLISPSGRALPFARERDGMVPGEGSALWMLETEESARRRDREPRIEVCGFGAAHDAHSLQAYDLNGEAAGRAIREALESSGIPPSEIGIIVSGASGSPAGDLLELRALRRIFAESLAEIPLCAPKGAFGEALGASGALLAAAAASALERAEAPAWPHREPVEEGLRLPEQAVPLSREFALVTSFGCDGNNAALVLRRLG